MPSPNATSPSELETDTAAQFLSFVDSVFIQYAACVGQYSVNIPRWA
ncbi:hypothetical protein QWZ16_16935 [Vibrio ostreicida]|uniref:Uncharacterized protein n=1 Tax=Vibrio ostreicida TaxID=526588 RepID=A0ABT8BX91_9VIBR|nr:hypothetical protein [Vibrio ostreicida]MDN3611289.1 hypothetical protein [Vibrio ostreicida]